MIIIKHFGDITQLHGDSLPVVNVIIGGSPCQDLSVAGKRAGLAGERSGLFMDQIRIIKEMRKKDAESGRTGDQIRPRFMVWENVCFSGDTLITTDNGFKRIDEIQIGDLVLTHAGRYMPVAAVHKTENQKCISVKAQGSVPVVCTGNHPFLAIKALKHKGNIIGWSDPEYIRADELTKDHRILSRNDISTLDESFMSEADAWAVGRWLADGSVDLKKSNPRIFISCGDYKLEYAEKMLSRLPETIYKNKPHKTATNFVFTSRRFYGLIEECGIGAANKRVPSYVFNLPITLQAAVLDGYMSGDGYKRCRRSDSEEWAASTVSKHLAYGIARLIRNVCGVPVSISMNKVKDGKIGNHVLYSRHPVFSISATVSAKTMKNNIGDYIMNRVKSITEIEETRDVYNLSVLEDNTYVANGFVVHNCGALSVNDGKDFAAVLEETIRVVEPEIPDIYVPRDGWTLSGAFVGRGWSVAWRVLDAQFWGVPQRRRRIALIADFGGQCASKVLFERNSLPWDFESCKAQGQGIAGDAADRSGESSESGSDRAYGVVSKGNGETFISEERHTSLSTGGGEAGQGYPCVMQSDAESDSEPSGLLNQGDVQSKHIYSEDAVVGTLCSGTTEGMNIVPSVMQKSDDTAFSQQISESPVYCVDQGAGKGMCVVSKEISPTLATTHGGTPVITDTIAIEGNGSRESHKGNGYAETDQMYTLNTVEQHSVCYGISAYESNAMLSSNPHSGVYEADTARTLDLNGGNPACNQGGIAVVEPTDDYTGEPYVLHTNQNQSPITHDGICPTLVASMGLGGGYVPMITESAGFLPSQGAKAEGIGFAMEQAPTLRSSQDSGVVYPDVARTLTARNDGSPCIDRGPDVIVQSDQSVFENHSQDSRFTGSLDTAPTVAATYGMGGNNQPLVVRNTTETETAPIACDIFHCDSQNDKAFTLKARDFRDPQIVAQEETAAVDCRNGTENPDINGTLQAKDNGGTSINTNNVVRQNYIVRRLTVLECTRLQGLPDGWVEIGDWIDSKGKKHKDSDSAKYRALGNAIAIPPWLFVLSELNRYCDDKGMGSLFNGIACFPLIWSFLNGKENCVWCSEIDEFCVALSKLRFPDTSEKTDERKK